MAEEATTAELLDAAMTLIHLQARLLHGTGTAAEFTQAATLRDELEQATRSDGRDGAMDGRTGVRTTVDPGSGGAGLTEAHSGSEES